MRQLNIVIAMILLCGTTSCHKKKAAPVTPSYPVQVAKAVAEDTPIFIEALGHVQSITSINIYSRIEGELTGVFFQQGQEVKKGDLLFTIDPKPYQASVKQAQGALDQALANYALSEEKVRRYRMLTKDEFYSQMDYETLQANMAANAALVLENQGQLDQANINLDYCWIYAPIDGMVGILNIDYGNLICVSCQNPLVTLNQMAPIFVTFSIPEFQLPKIQKAMYDKTARVIAAYENFEEGPVFQGELYMLDNAVDQGTGMIKLRAIFDNKDRALWPGQFIRNRLVLSVMQDAVVIPYAAVQVTQGSPVIFVLKEDSTIEQREIKLGQRKDETIIALSGVKAGETVVVDGQINLFNGSKVHITGNKP